MQRIRGEVGRDFYRRSALTVAAYALFNLPYFLKAMI